MNKSKILKMFAAALFALVLFGCKKEDVNTYPPLDQNAAEEECAVLVIPKDAVVRRIDGIKRGLIKTWSPGNKAGTVLVPAGEHTFTFEYSKDDEGWAGKDLKYTVAMDAGKMYMVSVALGGRRAGNVVSTIINVTMSTFRDTIIDKIPFIDLLPRANPKGLVYTIDEIDRSVFDEYLHAEEEKIPTSIRVISFFVCWLVLYAVVLLRMFGHRLFMGRLKNSFPIPAVILGIALMVVGLLALNYNSSGGILLNLLAIILIGFGWSFQDIGAGANKRGLAALGQEEIEYGGDSEDVENLLGQLAAKKFKNKYEKAYYHFTIAIKQSPCNPIYSYNRGTVLSEVQDWKEAIADFDRAIELAPKNAIFLNTRGLAYFNLQDFKKAYSDFAEAVRLDPDNDTYKQNLAAAQGQSSQTGTSASKLSSPSSSPSPASSSASKSSSSSVSINKTAVVLGAILGAVALGVLPGFGFIRLLIGAAIGALLAVFVNRKDKSGWFYDHSDGLFVAALIATIACTVIGGLLGIFLGKGFTVFLWGAFCIAALIVFKVRSGDFTIRGEGLANFSCLALVLAGSLFLFVKMPQTSRPAPIIEPVAEVEAVTVTVTADSLNLRAEGSGSAEIVKVLKKGDVLTVTGDAVNGWLPVQHNGASGFVGQQYVSSAQGAAQQTQTQSTQPAATSSTAASSQTEQPVVRQAVNRTATNDITAEDQRGKNDQLFTYLVIGEDYAGPVWGSGPYTDDSNIAKAAVHAGKIKAGETGYVTIRIMPGQSSYQGTIANGVETNSYGSWHGSYEFE